MPAVSGCGATLGCCCGPSLAAAPVCGVGRGRGVAAGECWGPLDRAKWAEEKGWSPWKPPAPVPGITHPPETQRSPRPWLEGVLVSPPQAGCSQGLSPVKSCHHRDLRDPTSLAKGPCPSDWPPGSEVFCCADPGLAGVCLSPPRHSFGCRSLGLVSPIDPAPLPASLFPSVWGSSSSSPLLDREEFHDVKLLQEKLVQGAKLVPGEALLLAAWPGRTEKLRPPNQGVPTGCSTFQQRAGWMERIPPPTSASCSLIPYRHSCW